MFDPIVNLIEVVSNAKTASINENNLDLSRNGFGSPFSFTGEPLDDNGLLYLRARYYSPELGVFTALDPVEGSAQQAMSLNRYGYVTGNVVNMTDPSGMIPTKNEVRERKAAYSCKCGWIDLKHVRGGIGTFGDIKNSLLHPISYSSEVVPDIRIIRHVRGTNFNKLPSDWFEARIWAYVPETILDGQANTDQASYQNTPIFLRF